MKFTALVLLSLSACSATFDNPLDPAGVVSLKLGAPQQVGFRHVSIPLGRVAHPKVTGYRLYRSAQGVERAVALEVAASVEAFVDEVPGPGQWRWSVTALTSAQTESAGSAEVALEVLDTAPVEVTATHEGIGYVVIRWTQPAPWITEVELERFEDAVALPAERLDATLGEMALNLAEEKSYTWNLRLVDAQGGLGAQSSTATLALATPAPAEFEVYRSPLSAGEVFMTWQAVPGALSYRVEVGEIDVEGETLAGETQALELTVPSLDPAKGYRWRVAAVGASGQRTAWAPAFDTPAPGWRRLIRPGVSDALPDWPAVGAQVRRDGNGQAAFVLFQEPTSGGLAKLYRFDVRPFGSFHHLADLEVPGPIGHAFARPQGDGIRWFLAYSDAAVPGAGMTLAFVDPAPGASLQLVSAGGTSHPGPAGFATAYDREHDSLYVHGGVSQSVTVSQLSRLDFSEPPPQWSESPVETEVVRRDHAMAMFNDGELFLFGGADSSEDAAVPALLRARPRDEAPEGFGAVTIAEGSPLPPALGGMSIAHDPDGDSFFVAGGLNLAEASLPTDAVWQFTRSTATWREWTPTAAGPAKGALPVQVFDFAEGNGLLTFDAQGAWLLRPDATPRWERSVLPPSPRVNVTIGYDPTNDQLVLFGGEIAQGVSLRKTNELHVLRPRDESPWRPSNAVGVAPSARTGAAMIFDTQSESFLVYGGLDGTNDPAAPADLKRLRLGAPTTWAHVGTPANPPAAREGHVLALFDQDGDGDGLRSLYSVGGRLKSGVLAAGEIWRLPSVDSPEWVNETPSTPAPSFVAGCSPRVVSCWDEDAHEVVSVGGASAIGPLEAWRIGLGEPQPAWSKAPDSGPSGCLDPLAIACVPVERAAYVLVRDQALAIDAAGAATLWRVGFAGGVSWQRVALPTDGPGLRIGASLVYTPFDGALVLFGGESGASAFNDVWRLALR